tara:strand:+ start:153 stop:518 length:366 start_codon:yes stop_codon:yes gene_type:complete
MPTHDSVQDTSLSDVPLDPDTKDPTQVLSSGQHGKGGEGEGGAGGGGLGDAIGLAANGVQKVSVLEAPVSIEKDTPGPSKPGAFQLAPFQPSPQESVMLRVHSLPGGTRCDFWYATVSCMS